MSQIAKKFIQSNAVDETKIRLSNTGSLRARNAANSGDVDILQVNASDRIVFASVPQSTSDASAANDLVRFSQLGAVIEGLKAKEAVRAATLVAGTLATSFEDGDVIDGITLATGDRILIKDQAAPEENGIYIVQASGAPVRASDFNNVSEIPGAYTVVQLGTQQGVLYVTTSVPAVLNTDPILFVARAAQTYTGGDMISLSGGAFSVDLASTSGLESTNPGNAAGQLRLKLEASNPSLYITGSNELAVKLNTVSAIGQDSGGLFVKILGGGSSPLTINGSNELDVRYDTTQGISTGSNGLQIVLSGGAGIGGLEFQSGGIGVLLETSNPTLKTDAGSHLGVKLDAAGAIVTGASGIKAQVDAATVKINGSNQLEGLKEREQAITLSGTDITNQYVDLAFAIYGTSASVNSASLFVVGGPMQDKTVDYTVSLTGGSGGVTRITFVGDLGTGGAAELIAGDKLVIKYSYLT